MKKMIIVGSIVLCALGFCTGCSEKPIEVRDHVVMTIDGEVQEWDEVYYMLNGKIVDKNGNPLEE